MKPYYHEEKTGITVFHGDCREILPSVTADVLVTDPPYGIAYRNRGGWRSGKAGETLLGDEGPFDPSHLMTWLQDRPGIIWGANHFANQLPPARGWLVWDKRMPEDQKRQGDAELAWCNVGGAVRIIRVLWNGGCTSRAENGAYQLLHPTQKPERVMRASIEAVGDGTIVDPYMGSGTTLVAAKSLGRSAIGIELEERYCEIAAKRLRQEYMAFGSE